MQHTAPSPSSIMRDVPVVYEGWSTDDLAVLDRLRGDERNAGVVRAPWFSAEHRLERFLKTDRLLVAWDTEDPPTSSAGSGIPRAWAM